MFKNYTLKTFFFILLKSLYSGIKSVLVIFCCTIKHLILERQAFISQSFSDLESGATQLDSSGSGSHKALITVQLKLQSPQGSVGKGSSCKLTHGAVCSPHVPISCWLGKSIPCHMGLYIEVLTVWQLAPCRANREQESNPRLHGLYILTLEVTSQHFLHVLFVGN